MSFSGTVKKELTGQIPSARHCRLAELSAMCAACGKFWEDEDGQDLMGVNTFSGGNSYRDCSYSIESAAGLYEGEIEDFGVDEDIINVSTEFCSAFFKTHEQSF